MGVYVARERESRSATGDRLGWIDRRGARHLRCPVVLRYARSTSGAIVAGNCERTAGRACDARRLGGGDARARPALSDRVYGGGALLCGEPAPTDAAGAADCERVAVRSGCLPVYEYNCGAAFGDSSEPDGAAGI